MRTTQAVYNNISQTMPEIKLFRHQEQAINLFPQKKYLAWEVGTGKTIGALAIARHHGFDRILVVAPKSAHQTWLHDNRYFNLDIELATYERFRDKINDFSRYHLVVFDEAHRLSYTKTQWTRKAIQLRIDKKIKEVLLLSGTPLDMFHKIYAQLKVINPQDEMFQRYKSYSQFVNAYFELDEYFKPRGLLRPEFKHELKAWFEKYAYIVKREDVVELPPLQEITVELQPVELEYELSNYELANFMKEYHASALTKEKLEYVLDFLSENPSTIVFTYFIDFVNKVREKFGNRAYYITGQTSAEYRMQVIARQDKSIISTYAMGEGANLQRGYKNIIFASLPLKYIDMEQAIGRVYRTGQDKKVAVYHLIQNGIDKAVLRILKSKRNVVEYLKRKQET
jgi:SNF2 family DNA or RNA helicase